jgi:hypothetical protein
VEEKIRKRESNPNPEMDEKAAQREMRVWFNSDVAEGMPWRFTPTQVGPCGALWVAPGGGAGGGVPGWQQRVRARPAAAGAARSGPRNCHSSRSPGWPLQPPLPASPAAARRPVRPVRPARRSLSRSSRARARWCSSRQRTSATRPSQVRALAPRPQLQLWPLGRWPSTAAWPAASCCDVEYEQREPRMCCLARRAASSLQARHTTHTHRGVQACPPTTSCLARWAPTLTRSSASASRSRGSGRARR